MVDPSREGEEEARSADEAARDADTDAEREDGDVSTRADTDGEADEGTEADEAVDADAAAVDVAAEPEAGDEQTQPGLTAPSAGTLLREAREARGIALEDLARTLNLHPTVVTALEGDDDGALPSAPFVRGYLRSYARLMGMDPAPLLEDHDSRTGGVVVEVRPSHRLEEPIEGPGFVHKRPGTIMIVATVGFVAVVVGALLLLRPDAFRRTEAPGAEDASVPLPEIAAPPVSQAPSAASSRAPAIAPVIEAMDDRAPSDAAGPDGTPGAGGVEQPEDGAADGDAASDPAADPEPSPDAAAASEADVQDPGASGLADDGILLTRTADGTGLRVYAGGEDHLHFAFTEDCWVEVLDGDDVSVFQDIVRDGEVLDLWGRAPFRIRLGYAPAVELTYNGSRVALRPFTRNDVASLTLGR